VIVGFGDYRAELEALAPERVLFTGALEHRHLVHLLPLADVSVVPSIFPEAFGMVAAGIWTFLPLGWRVMRNIMTAREGFPTDTYKRVLSFPKFTMQLARTWTAAASPPK
jgi:hypothetical protein